MQEMKELELTEEEIKAASGGGLGKSCWPVSMDRCTTLAGWVPDIRALEKNKYPKTLVFHLSSSLRKVLHMPDIRHFSRLE